MAIHKAVQLDSGIEVPNAYFRIENMNVDRRNTVVFLAVYRDADAAKRDEEGKPAFNPIHTLDFTMPTPSGDLFKEVYTLLMSREVFAGAIEV